MHTHLNKGAFGQPPSSNGLLIYHSHFAQTHHSIHQWVSPLQPLAVLSHGVYPDCLCTAVCKEMHFSTKAVKPLLNSLWVYTFLFCVVLKFCYLTKLLYL